MGEQKQKSGWLNILVDYGPLLVFLGVYKFNAPAESSALGEIAAVIRGTIAFWSRRSWRSRSRNGNSVASRRCSGSRPR